MNAYDYGVRFGQMPDLGLEGQKAFPFIYTFVNHNDAASNNADLTAFAPLVPANGSINVNVLLDPDYNFKLLTMKFSAYYLNGASYQWYDTPAFALNYNEGNDAAWEGTSLVNFIRMSVSVLGSGSNMLFGGQNTNAVPPSTAVNGKIPLPLTTAQGYDYGFYAVRRPYIMPRQAILSFDITNDYSHALYVAAAIYGMKVRV